VPLLCDSKWQVAVPLTSNPKSVQNHQRSSPGFLALWVREILGRGQYNHIAAQNPSSTAVPFNIAVQGMDRSVGTKTVLRKSTAKIRVIRAIEIAVCLSLSRSAGRDNLLHNVTNYVNM
jgi:hypothetical protein